jgi:hypothetical protein
LPEEASTGLALHSAAKLASVRSRARVVADGNQQKVPGANLRAIRANDFPRQANGSGQTTSDHASLRTDPDSTERQTGIYGWPGAGSQTREPTALDSRGPCWTVVDSECSNGRLGRTASFRRVWVT